ncbi:MAG: alpha/beta hydrolase [Pseudomonadota bacterium]
MRTLLNRRHLLATLLALSATVLAPGAVFGAPFASERIGVTVKGEGSDVVLVPGLNSSPRVWAELIAAVPGHRYHLVHIAGFAGRAKGGNGDGAVAAPVADEIARYIAQSGLDKPAVIGHSMGGSIALMLATRHPQALSRVMVLDMLPFLGALFGPPGTTAQSIKPTADAILAQMRAADPQARQVRAQANLIGMIETVAMRAGALDDSNSSDPDVSARSYHELIVTDLMPELARITVPATVLYVTPKGIPLSDVQMDGIYQGAYTGLKGVQLKRIPASAHFIMWDQPQRFQDEVRIFLK